MVSCSFAYGPKDTSTCIDTSIVQVYHSSICLGNNNDVFQQSLFSKKNWKMAVIRLHVEEPILRLVLCLEKDNDDSIVSRMPYLPLSASQLHSGCNKTKTCFCTLAVIVIKYHRRER
jgi:hypothetical protein